MGLWDYISSTTNSVNENAIKPAQNLCSASYSYGCAAAGQIGNAVQKLRQQVQDEDTRSKMGQFASDCAKNATVIACREGFKALPGGGPIVEIVSRSSPNNKKLNNHKEIMELRSELKDQKEKMKKLEALIDKMGKENSGFKKVVNQAEVHEPNIDVFSLSKTQEANKNQAAVIRTLLTKSLYSNANKQPDDLIRDMIMKGFISTRVVFDASD